MDDPSDRPAESSGDDVAKWTFISSIVLAVLFIGSVFIFILW